MKHLACLLIRFYRKFISPIKPTCCRFTPSCSAYALEAFTYRGFFVGFFLSVRRIFRCNPFGPCGYDPVPRRATWKRIDLLRKKMGDASPMGQGASSAVKAFPAAEKKSKRKVAALLPWEACKKEK